MTGPFGPPHPRTLAGECWGFAWVGQSFASCNECSRPYWEHTHEAALDHDSGAWYRKPITPGDVARVEAKWGNE